MLFSTYMRSFNEQYPLRLRFCVRVESNRAYSPVLDFQGRRSDFWEEIFDENVSPFVSVKSSHQVVDIGYLPPCGDSWEDVIWLGAEPGSDCTFFVRMHVISDVITNDKGYKAMPPSTPVADFIGLRAKCPNGSTVLVALDPQTGVKLHLESESNNVPPEEDFQRAINETDLAIQEASLYIRDSILQSGADKPPPERIRVANIHTALMTVRSALMYTRRDQTDLILINDRISGLKTALREMTNG